MQKFTGTVFYFWIIAAATAAHARIVPRQLNLPGFAACLNSARPDKDLRRIRRQNEFWNGDLLLVYLSTYPGKRLAGPAGIPQDRAREQWSRAFEPTEERAAEELRRLAREKTSVTPLHLFERALDDCPHRDAFCAALVLHNALRTLGRHDQAIYRQPITGKTWDLNPRYFRRDRNKWLGDLPRMQSSMISLRRDNGGDRWGEWYHFFGILAYSIHSVALHGDLGPSELAVQMNELLNPVLAGGREEPEKAQLDRDSIEVAWRFLNDDSADEKPCGERGAYVSL